MEPTADTEMILSYPVVIQGIPWCIDLVVSWIENDDKTKVFICANPHSLILAEKDPVFQKAIHDADLVTPDGSGIVLASKILHGSIKERVTGSDIFWGLSEKLNQIGGKSYFFLGSTEDTLSAVKDKLAEEYPNIDVAGTFSPPYRQEFSEEESKTMIEAVNAARPDVLWVGMTAPKQEKWIYQYRDQLNVKFIGAIGAVFDFYAGNIKRSPEVFQSIGLEWLPRLLQEPRRLFRRNFVSSPLFLYRVMKQRLSL